MGGVELLSEKVKLQLQKLKQKRCNVNCSVTESITAQQFFEWNEKLQNDEILVREIIDIDTNYMEDESAGPSTKQKCW